MRCGRNEYHLEHSRQSASKSSGFAYVCDECRTRRGVCNLTYIHLTYGNLILPAMLVVINGLLSIALHLGLERHLAIAAVRMLVQLVLVGYVLTFLFAAVSPFWTAVAAVIM